VIEAEVLVDSRKIRGNMGISEGFLKESSGQSEDHDG